MTIRPGSTHDQGSSPRKGEFEQALEARIPHLLSLWREGLSRRAADATRGRENDRGPKAKVHPPGNILDPGELASIAAALLKLQRGLTGGRRLAGESYMEDPALLGAYLLYYWPVSYLQTALALGSFARKPRRVLDLGSGPGPASAAFLDRGAEELLLADGSGLSLALAGRVLGPEGRCRTATAEIDLESPNVIPPGPFGAIVLSHTVNELWKGRPDRLSLRLALLEEAAARLSPEGFLLVIEPAPLLTSREALALRDGLVARGFPLLGPCVYRGPCPALAADAGQTCHAEHPWEPPEPVASLARAAGLDRDSVKMTWFALGPRNGKGMNGDVDPGKGISPSFVDLGRALVVSDPMLNKAGRTRYLVCGEGGRRAFSASGKDPRAREQGFFGLARGDLVRVTRAEARPAADGSGKAGAPVALGYGPETSLEVLARALRP